MRPSLQCGEVDFETCSGKVGCESYSGEVGGWNGKNVNQEQPRLMMKC